MRKQPLPNNKLFLAFGFSYQDLYHIDSIKKLDQVFLSWLNNQDNNLYSLLLEARSVTLDNQSESKLIIELAPYVEQFIGELFNIVEEVSDSFNAHNPYRQIAECKRNFVQRRVAKQHKKEDISHLGEGVILADLALFLQNNAEDFEIIFAENVMKWLKQPDQYTKELQAAINYTIWALWYENGLEKHKDGTLFHLPQKLDYESLVELKKDSGILHATQFVQRKGFQYTNTCVSLQETVDQASYCIYCHNQGKDSCSKGFKNKEKEFIQNALGVSLTGCPLEEKISEMNYLKSLGYSIGALAVITIDNPMVAATGHRICNDCMKSCIYQKQEPVDIPKIETRILEDVINLSWGFEIYSLLTRWNPLNFKKPYPLPDTNKKVLIVGMGPSGFTLAHYLLNDGHIVVGIDGLKIEPLEEKLLNEPIFKISDIFTDLDTRIIQGFGGVAEYGITVRWNKNYLIIIRLLLERRKNFALYDGVKFGGNVDMKDAWLLGFDHIALAVGAGKPNIPDIKNNLTRSVRMASDFLMSLQLTGAAKFSSLSNLQINLPLLVIGGGLTALDTATEALAYYPIQVAKFKKRYEILVKKYGEEKFFAQLDEFEKSNARKWLEHAEMLENSHDPLSLLQSWGGVNIVYRKSLQESPCYRLNHEEVAHAMSEGIGFIENVVPLEVVVDEYGFTTGLKFLDNSTNQENIISVHTILIATGTQPNVSIKYDDHDILIDDNNFKFIANMKIDKKLLKSPDVPFLIHQEADGKSVSCFGDSHPAFSGNVVKAMASAKRGSSVISELIST